MNETVLKVELAINQSLGIDLNTRSRKRHIIDARIIMTLICRDVYGCTYKSIGEHTKRNHASIINQLKRGRAYLKNEIDFKVKYEKVLSFLPDQTEIVLRTRYKSLLSQTRETYKSLRRLQLERKLNTIR